MWSDYHQNVHNVNCVNFSSHVKHSFSPNIASILVVMLNNTGHVKWIYHNLILVEYDDIIL